MKYEPRADARFNLAVSAVSIMAMIFILDAGVGAALRYLYFAQNGGQDYEAIYAMDKMDAETIVLGSSRANHHYAPDILERELQTTCYNAGRDGQYVFYYEAVLEAALSRYKPKRLILDFNPYEFDFAQDSYDRLSALTPFYHSHPEIRPILHQRSKFERLKLWSRIYPFNSMILTVLQNLNREGRAEKGFVPMLPSDQEVVFDTLHTAGGVLDSVSIASFDRMVQRCRQNGIDLYVVISPSFRMPDDMTNFDRLQVKTAAAGVPLLNYAFDPAFRQRPDLFADNLHLSREGAERFTKMLSEAIRASERAD